MQKFLAVRLHLIHNFKLYAMGVVVFSRNGVKLQFAVFATDLWWKIACGRSLRCRRQA